MHVQSTQIVCEVARIMSCYDTTTTTTGMKHPKGKIRFLFKRTPDSATQGAHKLRARTQHMRRFPANGRV